MKTKDKGLAYWKGRKLDAQEACRQAKEHYRLMLQCVTHATRQVNKMADREEEAALEACTEQEKQLFCIVCFMTRCEQNGGVMAKSPQYLKEKLLLLFDPVLCWQTTDIINRGKVLAWFEHWSQPKLYGLACVLHAAYNE
ncbi:hypothetical protein LCGC14_0664310 [marine sediment metagenome]|uniref:Uncharacterized protein n=1 Tax=marine sediment metagenome TaxID=412755 RepID=A0A0F9QSU9_9ZZZZ